MTIEEARTLVADADMRAEAFKLMNKDKFPLIHGESLPKA